MLWTPPKKAAASEAGLHTDTQLLSCEAARQAGASISSGTDSAIVGHHSLILSSWRQFISRWLSRAAAEDSVGFFGP